MTEEGITSCPPGPPGPQGPPGHPPLVAPEQATKEKGYAHPGSFIVLPDGGGTIHLQYGHPDEVGRNGCFMVDVVEAIINNLSVYQQPGHPMACPETEGTLAHLRAARDSILARKRDRKARDVLQTDKP